MCGHSLRQTYTLHINIHRALLLELYRVYKVEIEIAVGFDSFRRHRNRILPCILDPMIGGCKTWQYIAPRLPHKLFFLWAKGRHRFKVGYTMWNFTTITQD